jgi:hypothetical protein
MDGALKALSMLPEMGVPKVAQAFGLHPTSVRNAAAAEGITYKRLRKPAVACECGTRMLKTRAWDHDVGRVMPQLLCPECGFTKPGAFVGPRTKVRTE